MAVASVRELERRAEAWRPWRAYAAMYLWRIASQSAAAKTKLVPRKIGKRVAATSPVLQPVSMVV
jgi:hypothetical protein